jgi:outer membrane protein TolC
VVALLLLAEAAGAQTPSAPETLDDAWRVALAQDRRVAAARQLTGAAEQGLVAAKASRLPALNLEGGYTALSHAPSTIVDIPPLIIPGVAVPLQLPFDRLAVGQARLWSYTAAASVPVYTSGRIEESIAGANATLRVARADEAATALEIKLRVAEAFVAVLRAQSAIDVIDTEVASLSAHAIDAANLFEQGVTARNDRLAAEVTLADARQRRIQAAHALDGAAAAYNRLLNRPLDRPVTLAAPGLPPVDGDIAGLTARAVAARPELAGWTDQADVHAHRAAGRLAVTRPQASVAGGYSYQQNQYQLYPGLWSVRFDVRWTVFDGGASRAGAAADRGQADAAISHRDDLASIVALEVRQAWLEVDSTARREQVARDAIEQADENLRVTRDRYTAGVGIATEVLDAEALRARAHTNAASASYDHILALVRLRRAIGDL